MIVPKEIFDIMKYIIRVVLRRLESTANPTAYTPDVKALKLPNNHDSQDNSEDMLATFKFIIESIRYTTGDDPFN